MTGITFNMKMFLFLSIICAILTPTSSHVGEHVAPKLPDRFSLRMEVIDFNGEQVSDTTHIVDYTDKFMRSDMSPRSGAYAGSLADYGNRPLIVINDFNTGHEFVIDRWMGNCSSHAISIHNRGAILDGNKRILGMRHPYEMFQRKDMKYNGTTTIRNLPVERYRAIRNKTDVSLYYLRNPWGVVTEQEEHPQHGVPCAMDVRGYDNRTNKNVSRRINIYDFSKDHTELSTAPVHYCFDRFRTVQFRLQENPGIRRYSGIAVKYAITKAVAKAMNVSFLRVVVTGIYVPTDRNNNFTLIVFRIYEPVKAPGNLANAVVETTAANAIRNLKSAAKAGLNITVPDFGTHDIMWVTPGSVLVSDSPLYIHTSRASPTSAVPSTSTNGGLVAGVGIALLIVGLVVGFGAAFVFRKKFPCDKEVPYQTSP